MKEPREKGRKISISTAIVFCVVLAGGAFFLGGYMLSGMERKNPEDDVITLTEQRQNLGELGKEGLTNPLLQCDSIENLSNSLIADMKRSVIDFLGKKQSSGALSDLSVYFRDLNNGPWFGIDEKEEFTPGSLLKVPLMLTIFKKAEENPSFLEQKVLYESGKVPVEQYFLPEKEVAQGTVSSVEGLVETMIQYSDNNAALLLSALVSVNELAGAYKELGILSPTAVNSEYHMSVRTYGSFFRILFNATYLTRNHSERALKVLSGSKFDKGLRAGVPSYVTVASKFGERFGADGEPVQLHDCGIIYYPEHPYLLCIMARGKDFDDLASTIAGISKIVYEKIDKAY